MLQVLGWAPLRHLGVDECEWDTMLEEREYLNSVMDDGSPEAELQPAVTIIEESNAGGMVELTMPGENASQVLSNHGNGRRGKRPHLYVRSVLFFPKVRGPNPRGRLFN